MRAILGLRMAQVSDALTPICRLLSGIRLHTGEWTLADAQRCFEREPMSPGRPRSAGPSGGTYDPTYADTSSASAAYSHCVRTTQRRRGAVDVPSDGSGSLEISHVAGSVHIGSKGSGSVDVDDVAGSFTVDNKGSGGVTYRNVKGTVQVPERRSGRRYRSR